MCRQTRNVQVERVCTRVWQKKKKKYTSIYVYIKKKKRRKEKTRRRRDAAVIAFHLNFWIIYRRV